MNENTPSPDHPNSLPIELIPNGWYLFRCGYSRINKYWSANLHGSLRSMSSTQIAGYGESPREALLDALREVNLLIDSSSRKNLLEPRS
jgi:hypothetical protein